MAEHAPEGYEQYGKCKYDGQEGYDCEGASIPANWTCDGQKDCTDWSDEAGCSDNPYNAWLEQEHPGKYHTDQTVADFIFRDPTK